MADLAYHHGSKVTESPDTPSLLRVQNFGINFFNGTAPDADDAAFPVNKPVLVTGPSQLTLLRSAGTLLDDAKAHFAEGGGVCFINRVPFSATPATQQSNLIGDLVQRTGVYAALKCKPQTRKKPRVLVTAGDTGTIIEDGIVSVSLTAGGQNYTSAPAVAFTGGSPVEAATATATIKRHKVGAIAVAAAGTGYTTAPTVAISAPTEEGGVQATATAQVSGGQITGFTVTEAGSGYSVDAPPIVTLTPTNGGTGGAGTITLVGPVTAVTITDPGEGYQSQPSVGFTGGAGTGALALANVGDVRNPLISALDVVAHKIGARAYVHGPNTTDAEAIRARKTINSQRILMIDPKGIKNVNGVPIVVPIAAVFAGVRARVVASAEGVSGSVSNKIIRSLDGVARTIEYPDQSNALNEESIATVINEGGGLRTWGSRMATDNLVWIFDSVRATGDMVNEGVEDVLFQWVDRKFTKINLKAMLEDVNNAIRVFVLAQHLLGGNAWLSDLNVPTLNAQGKVFINVEFEPVGIMEQIHATTYRNILYYQVMLDGVRSSIESGPLTFDRPN